VEFTREGMEDSVMLPKELFDSAGDNLLQNALRKRKLNESVTIRATFHCDDSIEFSVCDSGSRGRRGAAWTAEGRCPRPGSASARIRPAVTEISGFAATARKRPGTGVLQPSRRSAPRRAG
jgi:hypothetical protein